MSKKLNLSNQTFGRLKVIEEHGRDKHGFVLWKCKCECGNETIVSGSALKSGHTTSCGCLMRKKCGDRTRKHGDSQTTLYHLYYNILSRCENPKTPMYEHYGGRGIKICREWHSWETFKDWAEANGYRKGLTIDRINVNGDYEPGNCRWVTRSKQMRNTRKTRYLTIGGITKPLIEWCEEYGLHFGTVSTRVTRGWTNPYEILFGK